LEGYTLREVTNLADVIKDAEAVIVIVQKGEEVTLTFSENIGELEVLDILASVTSNFYNVASEGDKNLH
jgi:hypothetical protein